MQADCVFCKIVKGEISSEKIFETLNFLIIKDIRPKVKGHSLVIPKKHIEDFGDLSENLYLEFMQILKDGVDKLKKIEAFKDYNLALNNGKIAGQIVSHTHFHILPRRQGDGFGLRV